MLVDPKCVMFHGVHEFQPGVYEIQHFGSTLHVNGFNKSPSLTDVKGNPFSSFGICDSYPLLLQCCPELLNSPREFVLTLTRIRKADQPKWNGMRWNKWGPFIGYQKPTCEYLYDEPVIETVYAYHIFEKINLF